MLGRDEGAHNLGVPRTVAVVVEELGCLDVERLRRDLGESGSSSLER